MRQLFQTVITYAILIASFPSTMPHAQSTTPDDRREIRVGVMAPLAGDYASAGEEIQRGITLAQEQLATEKINVHVIFEDACLPAQGVSALRKMIDRDRINAVVSNYCVITLNAIRPIIDKQKLITFQNSSVSAEFLKSSPFIFSTWPSIEHEVDAIVEVAGEAHLRHSGLIFLESPWGIGYANAFRQALSSHGLKPTVDASQALSVHDFRSEVTRLKAAGVQTILAAHTGAVMVSFLKQAQAMKVPGTTIFVPSDNDGQSIVDAAGSAAEGISLFSTESPSPNPVRSQYQERYRKRYKRDPAPLSSHAYDQLTLLGRAMHACEKDIACTQARIHAIRNFDGASGVFSMTSTGLPERTLHRKQVKGSAFKF